MKFNCLNSHLDKQFLIGALVAVSVAAAVNQIAGAKMHAVQEQTKIQSAQPQVQIVSKEFDSLKSRRGQAQFEDFDFGAPFALASLHHHSHRHGAHSQSAALNSRLSDDIQVEAGPTVSGNRRLLIGARTHKPLG